MTTYLLHDQSGAAVSIGTVLADPLPAHLTAVALTDADAAKLANGSGRWDPATLRVVDVSVQPPTPTAEDRLDAVRQVLAQVDTLTAPILTADVVDVLAELREVL